MDRAKDVARIEESIGCGILSICESNTMKAMSLEAAFVNWIASEPMDPEYLHTLDLHTPRASHIDMKDSEDFGVPVRVPCRIFLFLFVSEGHDVWVSPNVD